MKKNFNILTEQNNDSDFDWKKVDKSVYDSEIKKGKKGKIKFGIYYIGTPKQSTSTTTPQPTTTDLPSWVEPVKNCILQFGDNNIVEKVNDLNWVKVRHNNDSVSFFKNDGKWELYWSDNTNNTPDFMGTWSCDGGNLLIKCETDKTQWTKSTDWVDQPKQVQFTDCSGTYKKGCKSDKIKEVQSCLGVTPTTGQWWNKTQKAIEDKFPQFKDGFTDSDVDVICNRKQSATNPTGTNTTVTPQQSGQQTKKPFSYSDVKWVPFKESIKSKNVLKEQQSSLSTTEFWDKVINGGCLPSNHKKMGIFQDENEPERITYMTKDLDTDEIFYWFRNGVKINKDTNEKSTWTCKALEEYKTESTKFNELLSQFGIKENELSKEQLKSGINRITKTLQNYINKGAISVIFGKWNEMLAQKGETIKLVEFKDKSFDPLSYDTNDLNTNYYIPKFDEYGWTNVNIYFPKDQTKNLTTVQKREYNETECEDALQSYLTAAIQYQGGDNLIPQKQELKNFIKSCARYGKFSNTRFTKGELPELAKEIEVINSGFLSKWFKELRVLDFKEIKNILKGDTKVIKAPNPYIVSLDITNEGSIRNIIKTTLNEVKETKQKNLIEENIVRTRTFVLLENVKLTNKKREIKFVDEIIKESFFLQSQNFDQQIIKEEFWDVLTGFLGREGSESVFRTFKDRMGDWLVTHLSPNKKEGWIPKAIKKSINKIELRDVEKITDCKFLTKKLTDTIIDSLNEKMMKGETNENGLYDVVKSGMSYDVNHPRFKEELRFKISKMMCPLIDKVSGHLDKAFKTMKEKAIYG